jgi:hypothetical protein
MEHLDRYMQAKRNHLPLCRRNEIVTRDQPQQSVIGPVCHAYWLALRMALPWAIIVYCIAVAFIVFIPSSQDSAIEAALRLTGILIRCLYRLSIDCEQILNEFIGEWHSINASISGIL